MTVGRADDSQRRAFGAALDEAMRTREPPAAITEVALAAGVTDDAVRRWAKGLNHPPPATVFAIEELLDVPSGDLSRHLGYVPVGAVSVAAAIEADDRLSPVGRQIVLAAYRAARRS